MRSRIAIASAARLVIRALSRVFYLKGSGNTHVRVAHIDTAVLAEVARDRSLSAKFRLYLLSNKASLLISDILMFEILKNSDMAQTERTLTLLESVRNKYRLSIPLVHMHWRELVDYYVHHRMATPEEFKKSCIERIPEADWPAFVEAMRVYTERNQLQLDGWTNDWVFGKMITQARKDRKRKPLKVKDILSATGSGGKELQLSKFHELIDKKIDANAYKEKEKEILSDINSIGFQKFQTQVRKWIDDSMLPYDQALELTDNELNERVHFAEQLQNAASLLSAGTTTQTFYAEMVPQFGQRIGVARLIEEQMIEKRQASGAKVRRSDPYDILYLLLVPYIDLITCDNNTYEEINQVIRKERVEVNAKLLRNSEVLAAIRSVSGQE